MAFKMVYSVILLYYIHRTKFDTKSFTVEYLKNEILHMPCFWQGVWRRLIIMHYIVAPGAREFPKPVIYTTSEILKEV